MSISPPSAEHGPPAEGSPEGSRAGADRAAAALLQRRAARFQRQETVEEDQGSGMVVFERQGTHYALPLEELSEIRLAPRISPVPGVSAVIRGVVHMRGRMVAVHDLACLGGGRVAVPSRPWLLLGQGEQGGVALIADDVEGVRQIRSEALRPVPLPLCSTLGSAAGVTEDDVIVLHLPALASDPSFFCA
jgi:chemotaxis signal transduction protein